MVTHFYLIGLDRSLHPIRSENLTKICNTVARLDRKELLKYKNRNNYIKQNYLISNIYFDKNIYNFSNLLKNSFNNIKKENS